MQNHAITTAGLRLDALRGANMARLPNFRNKHGELAHSKPDGSDWSPAQWLQAVTGELGEYANIRKKFERGDLTAAEFQIAAAKELADVQTYLDLLAMQVGVDLGQATIDKFNEVSERVKSPIRLDADGWRTVDPEPVLARRTVAIDINATPRMIALDADHNAVDPGNHVAVFMPDYGLMFDAQPPVRCMNHDKAAEHAKGMALLGYFDWSLGTLKEQLLAVDRTRIEPAVYEQFFPNTPSTGWLWSEDVHASVSSYAWGVLFNHGHVGYDLRSNDGFVRAVRRVPASQS